MYFLTAPDNVPPLPSLPVHAQLHTGTCDHENRQELIEGEQVILLHAVTLPPFPPSSSLRLHFITFYLVAPVPPPPASLTPLLQNNQLLKNTTTTMLLFLIEQDTSNKGTSPPNRRELTLQPGDGPQWGETNTQGGNHPETLGART